MTVERSGGGVSVALGGAEVELFRLALKRATFEDTPPERQREILAFALELLLALGDDGGVAR